MYPTAIGGLLLVRGRPGYASITLREISFGRLAMDGVFRCVPRGSVAPRTYAHQRDHRIVIQVRRDVTIRVSSVANPEISRDLDGQVALCAFADSRGYVGGAWSPNEPAYTWVQTGRFRPERVIRFDGRDERIDLGWRDSEPRPEFDERGERWFVDSRPDRSNSARYASGGFHATPVNHPNGEIIYDSPNLTLAYGDRLRGEPQIRLLETTVQFRTYLYRRPGGYHGIAPLDPLAVVEWWYTERWERSTEGAESRRTGTDVRVLWILPNPIEPPSLDDAIREFRFR